MIYIHDILNKYIPIIKDLFLNLMGNAVVIAVTQLIVFPLLSRCFSNIVFGDITSVYGINTVIVVLTGDALANVRIIENNKDGNNFNILAILDSFIFSLILSLVLFFIYGTYLSFFDKILFSLTTSIMSVLEYGVSLYRIRLRYNLYLCQNILVSIGYVVGIVLFILFHHWSLIFMMGNFIALPLFIYKSGILHENFKITFQIKKILKSLLNISLGHVLSSIVSNLDRFVIPIVLGSSSLSVFFSANTLSKMFGLIMGPLSSVLLSHLSKLHINWTKHKLNKLTFYLNVLGVILIIPSYIISIIFIKFLYKNIYYGYSHMTLIIIMSCIATCFFEIWNIINTIYLTCLKSQFQVIINLVFFMSYLILSVLLSYIYGLIGFSIGYVLSIIFSCLISIIISNKESFWKSTF